MEKVYILTDLFWQKDFINKNDLINEMAISQFYSFPTSKYHKDMKQEEMLEIEKQFKKVCIIQNRGEAIKILNEFFNEGFFIVKDNDRAYLTEKAQSTIVEQY